MALIDEKKLEELRHCWEKGPRLEVEENMGGILDTLEKALAVVRAAQKASAEKEHTNCWHDELEKALEPF